MMQDIRKPFRIPEVRDGNGSELQQRSYGGGICRASKTASGVL